MERNKALFVAFSGPEIDQAEAASNIDRGYHCWNLKRFTRDEFIEALRCAIPPVSTNVLKNYKTEDSGDPRYGVDKQTYAQCTWGLLIPVGPYEGGMASVAETLFLLELYAPIFPSLAFVGTDFGISRENYNRPLPSFRPVQHQIFKRREFVAFFEMLTPQAQYATWHAHRVKQWNPEDWRLFAAALLFRGLREYDDGKSSFGWQRESADMACVLEALFTAEDSQNEEVGYRLRKRLAVLLSDKFPSIEDDIKKLYKQRSAFVHGSFFAQMAKDSKKRDHNLPIPDFLFLESQRDRVRWALVACLRLAQLVSDKPDGYKGKRKVIDILEDAVIDVDLRRRVLDDLQSLFVLLPPSPYRVSGS